jgi:hypothetical protein
MKNTEVFEEVIKRIDRHLFNSKNSYDVILIWRGYVSALMERGLISVPEYDQLIEKLEIKQENDIDISNLFLDPFEEAIPTTQG